MCEFKLWAAILNADDSAEANATAAPVHLRKGFKMIDYNLNYATLGADLPSQSEHVHSAQWLLWFLELEGKNRGHVQPPGGKVEYIKKAAKLKCNPCPFMIQVYPDAFIFSLQTSEGETSRSKFESSSNSGLVMLSHEYKVKLANSKVTETVKH